MTILHIVYSLIPGEFKGGIAKAVYELAVAQAEVGCRVQIWTTNINGSKKFEQLTDTVKQVNENLLIKYFEGKRGLSFTSSQMLKALLETSEFDVVHSHNTFLPFNRYAYLYKKKHGKKLFYHPHGALDPIVVNKGFLKSIKKNFYINFFEKKHLNAANAIFGLTQSEVEQVSTLTNNKKIFLLPNGISLNNAGYQPEKPAASVLSTVEKDTVYLGFIGRINAKKNIHLIISALALLLPEFKIKLLIGGEPNQFPAYKQELDQLIQKHNLEDKVSWLGFVNESVKSNIYKIIDIFVHPSESEGMAMAILEAMAAGVPTIVSDKCYMELAVKENALMECKTDAQSIADTIKEALRAKSSLHEIGANGKQYVQKHHDWHQIARNSIQVYNNN